MRSNFVRVMVVILLLTGFNLQAVGQIGADMQYQGWLRYQPKIILNQHWSLKSDIDERTYFFPVRQHQWIVRAQTEYSITSNWKVSAGGSIFSTSLPQDPDVAVEEIGYELRPELETNYRKQVITDVDWTNRVRVDFRFPKAEENYAYSLTRFRYMTGFSWKFSETWKWSVWDEILLNGLAVNDALLLDQNRIGTNITLSPGGPFSYDLAYFYWYQERTAPSLPYRRHIIRFTLQHQITKKAK